MNGDNQRTLDAYDAHVARYVDGTAQTVSGPSRLWIDRSLAGLGADARILELGSAFGRDAAYIQSQGFRVECSDASTGFLDHLTARGFPARRLNILTDDMPGGCDLVLANAVLLHFSRQEMPQILAKVAKALRPGGRFAFSLKQGDGEEWSSHKLNAPRYFCYWQIGQLPPLLDGAGFLDREIRCEHTGRAHADWLYVIARQ